jgi:hypothetical protein
MGFYLRLILISILLWNFRNIPPVFNLSCTKKFVFEAIALYLKAALFCIPILPFAVGATCKKASISRGSSYGHNWFLMRSWNTFLYIAIFCIKNYNSERFIVCCKNKLLIYRVNHLRSIRLR